jgi:hypothetical protein
LSRKIADDELAILADRVGSTIQDERGHPTWVTGESASVCQGTVQLQPIERLP